MTSKEATLQESPAKEPLAEPALGAVLDVQPPAQINNISPIVNKSLVECLCGRQVEEVFRAGFWVYGAHLTLEGRPCRYHNVTVRTRR